MKILCFVVIVDRNNNEQRMIGMKGSVASDVLDVFTSSLAVSFIRFV
jgi:hypothetical protein